jgi:phosphoribosylformimino-5-aminoimidazole carboxamide ribotide isomerase
LDVIPVIDLMGGKVVRARMGERDFYRPIDTPLSPTADPVDVVCGLLAVYQFARLYVADLDAIRETGDNIAALRGIREAFPALELWIDNGVAEFAGLDALLRSDFGAPVLGSESQSSDALIRRHRDSQRVVLSLDFRGESFQGPAKILNEPHFWPRRIIVMTLARVGSGAGPDFARLAAIKSVAEGREIFAAGGVRNGADLVALKAGGIAGALVATALHDKRVTRADLEAI